ncbi:Crp/Fnr family transcriptional regulator [Mucilaginibacter segetis]|uniref:Crp/Fnr family transcriptional regulator n=1 Tax=Mucilaginibacter segetis TaxID=2793071 RepID=A0A934PRY9_9SPHI|nr:Crp/Fnr family transcriptional regulator [Mucilaginibacter segetis]MBK0378542.1 Crp/Fnr family transcriptional regulator [Mucilaginibacter segetis]
MTSIDSLIAYLSGITDLSPAFTSRLHAVLKPEIYQPHQVFQAAGQRENRLWFVLQGFVRGYYFDPSGKEHTLSFHSENELIFSYEGFWQETADRYLEALQPTGVYSLSYEELASLLPQFREAQLLKEVFVRHQYQQERFRKRLLTWSAEERYRQTRKLQPELFRKASVRLIATYLNMTRENLSRLMAKDL